MRNVRRSCLKSLGGLALCVSSPLSFARPSAVRELVAVGTRNEGIFERRPDGTFGGMGVDLLRLLAQRHNYLLRFEIYPWRRALEVVGTNRADLLVAPYRTADRQRYLRYTAQAFFRDELVFYVRVDSLPLWDGDYSTLRERRIAVINGWAYGTAFMTALPQLRVSVTNTVENGLKMLTRGHVELFASNRRDTDPVLIAMGLQDKVMPLAPMIDVLDAYFACPLAGRYQDLPVQIDRLLLEMKKNGELLKLARGYGVTPA